MCLLELPDSFQAFLRAPPTDAPLCTLTLACHAHKSSPLLFPTVGAFLLPPKPTTPSVPPPAFRQRRSRKQRQGPRSFQSCTFKRALPTSSFTPGAIGTVDQYTDKIDIALHVFGCPYEHPSMYFWKRPQV